MRYLQYILHILQIHITASYIFKVPPFLNCEGPTFDPIWSVFRESAVANAQAGYPRNESLREMAVELISAFEPSMILGARAWVVQLRSAATGDTYHLRQAELNAADDVAFTLSTNIGLKENLGRAAAAQRSVQKDESDPTGFCLYGYVQALFIEFRHTVPLQEQGTAALQNDPRLATCHDRRPLLDVAEQLLGGETCETDFLESSDWPVRRLDVYVSLHSTLSLHSSPDCHVLFHAPDYLPRPAKASWSPKLPVDLPRRLALRLAAFGLHVASTLEPVAALRDVASTASPDSNLDVSYFGHPCYGRPGDKSLKHACVYKCQMLGSPCEDDAVAELLKGMFNSSGFYEEVTWSVQEALGELGSLWNRDLMQTDLIVCSGPLALCYLLDVLAPSTFMVMTLCSQLLWGAPPEEHLGAMLLGQVRVMSQNPRRSLVACNVFAASQCLYQTGVELPVVERVAHYLPQGVFWSAHDRHWKEVLVLRARYWHRLPGQYFMDVLEAFLRVNEFSHNFTFVMAASFGPDELPPDEIAGYRATVLIPNDLTVFAFVEVYALGVPTFVPKVSWLYRLRRAAPFGFLQPAMALPDLAGVHGTFRYPPFLTAKSDLDDLKTFLHWQQTSELHSRPHVQQFGSIPELLQLTASVDLLKISEGMKKYSAELRSDAASFWSSVLHRVDAQLSGTSNAFKRVQDSSSSTAEIEPFMSSSVGIRTVLDCSSQEFGAWNSFRDAFHSNAAAGFTVDWDLQAMAQSLWNNVQGAAEDFATASALFHQVLIGDAPVDVVINRGHCHYGLVAALFILARHDFGSRTIPENGKEPAQRPAALAELALQMLGGGNSALDFLEDSAWSLSSLDVVSLIIWLESAQQVGGSLASTPLLLGGSTPVRSIIEAAVPWAVTQWIFKDKASIIELPHGDHRDSRWKVAILGAHPSLCADVAFAVQAALQGRTEHQFFGLSCPGHHSASHHCSFRCEVLGRCSNDAIFDVILGQMLNWAEFTEKSFDLNVLLEELRIIVSSDAFLPMVDLQICTGPYILCHMLQLILDKPLLVYMGLTMTYMAPSYAVEDILKSARSIASDFRWTDSQGGFATRRTAMVATDLIRAAQFHHATGVWIAALPPLSLYQTGEASKPRKSLEAIALRSELWRRVAFGAGLRGVLRHFTDANTVIAFQTHFLPMRTILSYSAAIIVPWDNDVMSFYELYHVAMPLLVPDEKLMTKWLPAVRWGSLEFDQSDRNGLAACLVRLDRAKNSLRPWMNQSTLQSTWEGGAMTWIGASDYYRFPHVQHFHSVASLMAKLHELPLTAASFGMRSASQKIRSQTLAAYSRVLQHVLGFGATGHTSDSSLRQLTSFGVASPDRWNQMPLGGTCKNGFITQADFVQESGNLQVGLHQCLRLCDETAGCHVAVFNGLTCMVYDKSCNSTDLRREGDRKGYVAWKRS